MTYSIENLDVYRKSITTGASLYGAAGKVSGKAPEMLVEQLQRTALAVVTNLADGLGFWEKEHKAAYFAASKRAVLEALPLLELMVSMGHISAETQTQIAGELRDLAKMINGLLRGARRREGTGGENNKREPGEEVREGNVLYH